MLWEGGRGGRTNQLVSAKFIVAIGVDGTCPFAFLGIRGLVRESKRQSNKIADESLVRVVVEVILAAALKVIVVTVVALAAAVVVVVT